jgi:hypothetical protein
METKKKPILKFSHNWNNKLNNRIFTTIRKATPEKIRYYHSNLAKIFDVVLNKKKIGEAKLWRIDERKFHECDEYLLMLDVGDFNHPNCINVFKKFGIDIDDTIMVLTFEKQEGGN